ncbi:MAG: VIT and VWA domain-containing protein, partial [Deltaproteobacteria bacterium]|nr:VIT and VWA domain-containing protein [Deltaproteobacteria bacterium]
MLVNVRDSHKISIFKLLALALVFILGLGLAGFNEALAQTSVIAPREPPQIGRNAPYTVEAVELIANIDGQKAEVLFRQTVVNNSKKPIELDFMAPLPLGGQVSGLTFVSNGKELVGQIYPKDEAFQIYQQIVNRLKDPALLEWAGQGLYRARVFPLEPGKKSTLELSMTYLLPKVDGRVDFIFPIEGPLTQGRTIARQEVVITLNGQGLSGFYSPIDGVTIDQKSSPIRAELNLSKADIIDSFQFHYLMDSGPMGGMVLSHKPNSDEDGFFLFLVEPVIEAQENKPKIPKTVIFVLDRSGSMEGSKFTQAQGGLRFVLERLEPQDSFNLVDFSSQVTLFKPELVTMNDKNRSEAMKYINNLRAGGNTNIEEAMVSAIKQVPIGRPTYIIFLTDGQATTGITKEEDLIEIVLGQNAKKEANIFCFGVGHDVNSRLLDRLASGASGFSTFVEPNQSIEESIASFFRKITSPSLVRPVLTSSLTVNRLIPGRIPDIFLGVQSLVVGRYPKGGQTVLTLSGKVGDDNTVYTYQSNLTDKASLGGDFIAQLWAQR